MPERLEYELVALRHAGIQFSRRADDFAQGILVLDLIVDTADQGKIELREVPRPVPGPGQALLKSPSPPSAAQTFTS